MRETVGSLAEFPDTVILKFSGVLVATLPGVWRYRISARTGLPSLSILRVGQTASWTCNLYLSVAARSSV